MSLLLHKHEIGPVGAIEQGADPATALLLLLLLLPPSAAAASHCVFEGCRRGSQPNTLFRKLGGCSQPLALL